MSQFIVVWLPVWVLTAVWVSNAEKRSTTGEAIGQMLVGLGVLVLWGAWATWVSHQ